MKKDMKLFGSLLSIICILIILPAAVSCTKQQTEKESGYEQGIGHTGYRTVTIYAPNTSETKTDIASDDVSGNVGIYWKVGDKITIYGIGSNGDYVRIATTTLNNANIINNGGVAQFVISSDLTQGYESFCASNCGSTINNGASPEEEVVSTYCDNGKLYVRIPDQFLENRYIYDEEVASEVAFGYAHAAVAHAGKDLSFRFKNAVNMLQLYIDGRSAYAHGHIHQFNLYIGDQSVVVNNGEVTFENPGNVGLFQQGGYAKLHPGVNYIPFFPSELSDNKLESDFFLNDEERSEETGNLKYIEIVSENFDCSSYGKINDLGDVTQRLQSTVNIASWTDLIDFKQRVEGGEKFYGATINFTNDLSLTETSFTPIVDYVDGCPQLNGATINGNHHIINFKSPIFSRSGYQYAKVTGNGALFNCISSKGLTIKDLTINFESAESVSMTDGDVYSGAFIQEIVGYDEDVVYGPISLINCTVNNACLKGTVCGGLVGLRYAGSGEGLNLQGCTVNDSQIISCAESSDSLRYIISGYLGVVDEASVLYSFGGGLVGLSFTDCPVVINNCAGYHNIINNTDESSLNVNGAFLGAYLYSGDDILFGPGKTDATIKSDISFNVQYDIYSLGIPLTITSRVVTCLNPDLPGGIRFGILEGDRYVGPYDSEHYLNEDEITEQ